MPLGEHLEELRRRLFLAILGLIPIFCVTLAFGKPLLRLLLEPARVCLRDAGQPDTFTALSPLEVLGAYLKISTVAAVVVGTPWVLYQLWKFVAPGLYAHERRYVYFLLPLSASLTVLGVFFLYRLILPIILAWLVTFGSDMAPNTPPSQPLPQGVVLPSVPCLEADPPPNQLKVGDEWINLALKERRVCIAVKDGEAEVLSTPVRKDTLILQQFSIERYVSLLFTLTLAFAGIFQAPVVVLLLGWMGLIDTKFLKTYRRHAILLCLIIAAFISPGDPTSLTLLWIPLILLYELGGMLLKWFPAHRVAGKPDPALEGEG